MPELNYVSSPEYDEHIKKQNLQDDGSGLGVPAFDPLANRYPALKEQIGQWRGQGMSDADIDNGLAEQERELRLSGKKKPAEVDALFGRTEYTRGLDKSWLLRNKIGTIAQITGESEADVKARTIDAFKLGIPASTAIEHPEIHKRLVGEYGTRLESNPIAAFWDAAVGEAQNGEQAALLGGYIKKLTAGPLLPEDQQRLVADVRSYRERLAVQQSVEPDGFLAYIAKNTGELVGQQIPGISAGLKKYGLPMAAAGVATALAIPTGGLSLAGAGAALTPALVGAAATAAGTAGAYEDMMNREALETFLELMRDPKNQTPEGQVQAARLAMAKGMINAYIELGTLGNIGRMLNIPGMKTIGLLPDKVKSAFTRFLGSPAARSGPTAANFLKRYAGTYLKNVSAESFEEVEQAFVGDAFLNFARSLNGDQSLGEAMGNLFSADELRSLGLVYGQSAASFASGMLPGGLVRAGAGLMGLRAYNKTPQGKLHKALSERRDLQGEGDVVFLPREVLQTFNQSAVPAGGEAPATPGIEETLGVTDADFVESTGEVMIPREKYEEAVRENPALKAATEIHARYGAEGRTVAETVAAIRDNASDPLNADTPFAKSARDVRDRKIQALKDAGYDDQAAEAGGYVWAKYALRRACALGENELGVLRPDALTPAELDKLEIEGERAAAQAETPQKKSSKHRNFELGAEVEGALRELRNFAPGGVHDQAAIDEIKRQGRLKRDRVAWSRAVDRFVAGEMGSHDFARVMDMPLALQLAGAPVREIVADHKFFGHTLRGKHSAQITPALMKKLVTSLADPIMVFDSDSHPGTSLVAMLELQDNQGATVVVPVRLQMNPGDPKSPAKITSFYGKGNADTRTPSNRWFVNQIKKGNLRYINTKKSTRWSSAGGLQLPKVLAPTGSFKDSIKTEADLVKLRKENGNRFYQDRAPDGTQKERARIIEAAKANGTYLKTPYGTETNLTPEQWVLVRTKQFKEWFGDWEHDPENASKVLDGNGEPLVVYHSSTNTGFSTFSTAGSAAYPGTGAFFSGRKDVAATYSGSDELVSREPGTSEPALSGEGVYPVFLNLRNPYRIDAEGKDWTNVGEISVYDNETGESVYERDGEPFRTPREAEEYIERDLDDYSGRYEVSYPAEMTTNEIAQSVGEGNYGDGFDGVIFENVVDEGHWGSVDAPGDVYVAYAPNQIKAVDNRGTFDASGNIYNQSAWHGSPHQFESFDLGAIGTGEGGQTHGWGLYFARDRNIAAGYRERLGRVSKQATVDYDAVEEYKARHGEGTPERRALETVLKIFRDLGGERGGEDSAVAYENTQAKIGERRIDVEGRIADLESLKKTGKSIDEDYLSRLKAEREQIKLEETALDKFFSVDWANSGSLFEVDVPENDMLLDEDKSLAEHSCKVRKAIRKIVQNMTDDQFEDVGEDIHRIGRTNAISHFWQLLSGGSGKQVYGTLIDILGGAREASLALNEAGVKGITYDGYQDGRCFVVFDDKAISVINRFNQRENTIRRGQIRIGSHGEGLVTLFKNADRSTFFHEIGHMMLDDLIADGLLEKANARTKADLETVRKYLGIEDLNLSKRHTFTGAEKARYAEAQERFARSFEAYLMEGKPPTPEMKGVFARVRQWLIDIYHDLSRLDVELSPEVRDVFDHLLATPDEIDAARKTVNELALEESLLKQRLEELEGQEDLLPDEEYEKGYRKGFRKGVTAGRKREIEARRAKAQALKAAQAKRRAERNEINDAVKYMKRAVGMKSLSWRMQQAIRQKLEQYTLKRPNKKRLEAARELLEYIEQTPDAELEQFNPADQRYIRMLETTTLGDMTLADVRALRQEIENLVNQGREEFDRWEAERNSRREKWFAALNDDLDKTKRAKDAGGIVTNSADIGKQYDGAGGKAAKVKDWVYANTLGANRFFDWLGGGDGNYKSAWTRLFVDEVNTAFDEELRHVQERHLAMEEKMKDLGITAADLNKKVRIRGEAYSKDMLLHVYAGLQNENSRAAILYGNMRATWLKEGEEGVQRLAAECVGALSENEKKLARAVMRDFDENFGRINDACIEAYNMGMEQEKNYTPMSRLEFAGQSLNNLFDIDEAAMMKGQQQTAGAARAHLEKGFMQNRIKDLAPENQKAIELGLMSVWHDQVETQEHTAAYAKLAGDLHSVLMKRDKSTGRTLGAEVNDRFGHDAVANLREYTNIAVQGQNVTANAVMNGVSSYFGRNMAVAYLCLNLGTVLKQLTSIPRFLISANYGHLMTSIARFAAHPRAMLEKVYALDPQMKNRAPDAFMNVLRGARAKETNAAKLKYLNALETMMKPISFADRLVSSIGWWATYQSNLKNGLSKEAAVREAQRAVALTQQTPLAKDMPRLWNQQGVARLMMIFTSDMANTWGMTVYDLTHTKDGKKVLSTVTALAMTAVLMGFAEGGPDDDDDWITWMLHKFADQQISAAPLVGKEIMSALNVFMGDGYNQATYSSLAAPFVKLTQGLGGMAAADSGKVYGDGSTKFEHSTFKALEGTSLLTPFPFTAANRIRRIVRADDAGEAARILFGMRIGKK